MEHLTEYVSTEPIDEWIEKFEIVCEIKKIDDRERKLWCALKLGTLHRGVVGDLSTTEEWSEVKTRVIAQLGGEDQTEEAREALHALQKGTQSWEQVGFEARRLAQRAFGSMGEKVVMAETADALQRMVPRTIGHVVFRQKYKDVGALVKQIRREEAFEEANQLEKVRKVAHTATDAAPSPIEATTDTVAAMRRPPPTQPNPGREWSRPRQFGRGRGACYACQRTDHFVADCPFLASFLGHGRGRGRLGQGAQNPFGPNNVPRPYGGYYEGNRLQRIPSGLALPSPPSHQPPTSGPHPYPTARAPPSDYSLNE